MFRVLIVEDDPMVAMINEQYVGRNKKFQVVGKCHDGESALTYLKKNEVDLVILDVFMPYMNGVEVLHKIREKNYPVDVIMVTAANDAATLEETMHLGVLDYLVKPFDFERFQLSLEKFAVQHHALKDVEVLNQQSVDYIIDSYRKASGDARPKGIQQKTVDLILECLKEKEDEWMTGEVIAEHVGLSSVTVRRYMNHLVKKGLVTGEMNYETGGRPCMLYCFANTATEHGKENAGSGND